MEYAKFIDELRVAKAPRIYKSPTMVSWGFNENPALMKKEGFLPLIEDEKPERLAEGCHFEPRYSVIEASHFETQDIVDEENNVVGQKSVEIDDSSIRVSWVEVEDVVEEAEE